MIKVSERGRAAAPARRRLLTGLCALALLLPLGAGAAAHPQSETRAELERVDERLGEARDELDRVEGQRAVTLTDLREVEARRAELDGRLAVLDRELAGAQAGLDAAEQRLAESAAEYRAAEGELAGTRARLGENREKFQDRVRASFMYGAPNYTIRLLELDDVGEFTRAFKYVRVVMDHDREQVVLLAGLERQAQAQAEQLAALTQQREAQRTLAETERNRVAEVTAEQRGVRQQVAAEAQRHRDMLARLDSDQASYLALVSSLEAASEKLEAELRRMAEEERRRAEEARANRGADGATATEDGAVQGRMHRPSAGPITSGYGYRTHPIFGGQRYHAGIDFGAPTGAPVSAAEAGRILSAGWRGGYGNAIVIDHGGGIATLYAHLSTMAVSSGQRVARGQRIGGVGSTGYSTGPHLHFEVRVDGQPRDPMDYL